MASLNEHTCALAEILIAISDHSYMNFIYMLSANDYQRCNNDEIMPAAVSTAADWLIPTFVYKQTHESRD